MGDYVIGWQKLAHHIVSQSIFMSHIFNILNPFYCTPALYHSPAKLIAGNQNESTTLRGRLNKWMKTKFAESIHWNLCEIIPMSWNHGWLFVSYLFKK